MQLDTSQAFLGTVVLSNQTFALNHQWNGYQPHTEAWNYQFHAKFGNPFTAIGGNNYTYHNGDTVSFTWVWSSLTKPNVGDYAYVSCVYEV